MRFLFFLLFFSFPSLVYAQELKPFLDLPDDYVSEVLVKMRPQLKNFKISDTEFLGEETEEELQDPLLTRDEAEEILVRGIVSVTAEWCGLDWAERSFEPFMKEQRLSGRSEKQMTFVGALHGFGMGIMDKVYKESVCQSEIKTKIEPYLYN